MSFKAYLTSKVFLLNLLVLIGVIIVMMLLTVWGIRIYTNHGESFAVPDLTGMEMAQVEELAREKNLEIVISDSVYTQEAMPGAVVDQVPAAGMFVKEGRTVFLTICSKNPEQVPMPRLTDISYRQAVNIMQGIGLNVGKVVSVPSEYPNLVLSQKLDGVEIEEGQLVGKGSRIDLTIGKSSVGEKTVVPDLTGVSLEQAKNEIASLFLNVGAVIYDESVETEEDSLNAIIWKQRPGTSSVDEIELGTSIDLWLTIDDEKLNPETEKENF